MRRVTLTLAVTAEVAVMMALSAAPAMAEPAMVEGIASHATSEPVITHPALTEPVIPEPAFGNDLGFVGFGNDLAPSNLNDAGHLDLVHVGHHADLGGL